MNKKQSQKKIKHQPTVVASILVNIRAFLLLLLTLLLSIYLSWVFNAQAGYGYSWLYDLYEIDAHIEQYAPQNRFRVGFELTQEEDRKAIFQSIVESVHNNGLGLENIRYTIQSRSFPFLHKAEIIHLQDVSTLINKIHTFAIVCAILWLLLMYWYWHSNRRKPVFSASRRGVAAVFAILAFVIWGLFLILGAKQIFYQFHIWIFPENHQWFFYYQDSLMSTLMKAPDLFAGIALQILLLGIAIFTVLTLLAKKVMIKMGQG